MRARAGSGVSEKPPARAAAQLPCAAFLFAIVLGLIALSGSAAAQTTNNALTRLSSPNNLISMVPNAQGVERDRDYFTPTRPWWINYEDCVENDYFTFTLSTELAAGNQLEIWAGSENCANNRSAQDRGQCWILASQALQDQTVEVRVPVRNIVARRLGNDFPPQGLTEDVCDDSTDPSGEALTLYFMVVESGQGAEYFAWDGGEGGVGFDVVGPSPPGRISVGVGESQLAIELDNIPTDNQRERYEAFCVPEGATAPGVDAGVDTPTAVDAGSTVAPGAGGVTDAGLDAGNPPIDGVDAGGDTGAAPAACFTELLRVGQRPPSGYSCGESGGISTRLRTSRLINNTNYAVAVAGQDDLGNAGVISEIQCGRPIFLTDFYEMYSRDGGPGGGGFCSLTPGQQRAAGALGAVTLALALAGLGWRRTRGRA